jgi:hypothetical protein
MFSRRWDSLFAKAREMAKDSANGLPYFMKKARSLNAHQRLVARQDFKDILQKGCGFFVKETGVDEDGAYEMYIRVEGIDTLYYFHFSPRGDTITSSRDWIESRGSVDDLGGIDASVTMQRDTFAFWGFDDVSCSLNFYINLCGK